MQQSTFDPKREVQAFDLHFQQKAIKISNRELEILKLISYEHSEKSISKILDISHHTVHAHKRNLLRKFGANNAAGLVRKGFEYSFLR